VQVELTNAGQTKEELWYTEQQALQMHNYVR